VAAVDFLAGLCKQAGMEVEVLRGPEGGPKPVLVAKWSAVSHAQDADRNAFTTITIQLPSRSLSNIYHDHHATSTIAIPTSTGFSAHGLATQLFFLWALAEETVS
jgi:hypothetical protein